MKKLLLFLITLTTLFSNASYPELFAELGTPLYEADVLFSKLPGEHPYSSAIENYHMSKTKTLELSQTGDKKTYLNALRALAKEHDAIISILKHEMITAIKDDTYAYFITINDIGISALYQQESFKNSVYSYYREHKSKGESAYLEERIRSEKGFQKFYGSDISSSAHQQKSVILISRSGCGWCDKAKAFMRSKNISFTEHNIQSSAVGKRLYKKYQGSGVPLIIIGDNVIRGYDESSILNAL